MADLSHVCSLILTPADVALFREPRPFDAGSAALSQLPSPQTAAGALRTWLLTQFGADLSGMRAARSHTANGMTVAERQKQTLLAAIPETHPARWVLGAELAGPLLCHRGTGSPLMPIPLHIVRRMGDPQYLHRLGPLATLDVMPGRRILPNSGTPPDPHPRLRPCWPPTPGEMERPEQGFVKADTLQAHMLHSAKRPEVGHITPSSEIYQFEPRLGIGMDSNRNTTREGQIYSVSFLRLRDSRRDNSKAHENNKAPVAYSFRVDIRTDEDRKPVIRAALSRQPFLRFGGEGKVAGIELCEDAAHLPKPGKWPPALGRFSTYLATPGLFAGNSWYPRGLSDYCDLIGAIVDAPMTYSGWDSLRNQPLPTRAAVSSGAIYFWEIRDDPPADPPADPHGANISDDENDRQAGWGLCLRGEWEYV